MGVLDRLPVDCLLGRSLFGRTLSRQNVLDQWERNTLADDTGGDEAFVMTRRQSIRRGPTESRQVNRQGKFTRCQEFIEERNKA